MERKQCVPFVLLMYIYCCQQCETRLGLRVKCPIFLYDFNQIWIFQDVFVNVPNTRFHENPGAALMHADIGTDMTRLIGDFRDRAKTPKVTRFFCKSYGFLR
jgi:hypothetical protein